MVKLRYVQYGKIQGFEMLRSSLFTFVPCIIGDGIYGGK